MRMQWRRESLRIVGALGAMMASGFTWGETSGSVEGSAVAAEQEPLHEIVVTARKRAEKLEDVPISIAVASGETLRETGVLNLQNLAPSIPGLYVTAGVALDALQIRGIGSGVNFGFEQSVGQVADGVFYGRSRFSRFEFLDVDQVEILKGPQGALIGKNTTAGAINTTSAVPTRDFTGYVNTTYQFVGNNGANVEGAVSGALSERLQGRFAFFYDHHDGWVENLASGGHEPNNHDWAGRLSLAGQPLDGLDFILRWTHGSLDRHGTTDQLSHCNAFMLGFLRSIGDTEEDCTANLTTTAVAPRNGAGNYNGSGTHMDTVSLGTNLDLGGPTLTSVSGYARYDYLDYIEGDRTPAEILSGELGERYQQYSEEVRLTSPATDRLEYIVGMVYQNTRQFTTFDINLDEASLLGLPGTAGFSEPILTHQSGDSISGFAQVTYHLTAQWAATLGARYTYESKAAHQTEIPSELYTATPLTVFPAYLPPLNSHDIAQARYENNFSPTADIQWKPDPRVMAYVSVRRGFKGGGFDHQVDANQADAEAQFQFADEKVTAYELGTKLELGDSGTLNVAAFRSDFTNLQVSVLKNAPSGLAVFAVGNAAQVISQGVEVDATWNPLRSLVLTNALTYLHARYGEYDNAPCYGNQTIAEGCVNGGQNLRGKPLAYDSDWSDSLGADYKIALQGPYQVSFHVQGNYRSRFALTTALDPFLYQGGAVKLDASVQLADTRNGWRVSIVGRNLTDKITTSHGDEMPFIFAGSYFRYVDPPRTVALQASYNF